MDAQPQPKFTWFFEDEPIVPGELGQPKTALQTYPQTNLLVTVFLSNFLVGGFRKDEDFLSEQRRH